MTDEKLEKILQHALTPPVDDADIRIRPSGRRSKMKKITKALVAVAACFALVAVLGNTGLSSWINPRQTDQTNAKSAKTNSFTLVVNAEENGEGKRVDEEGTSPTGKDAGWVMGTREDGHVYYCISLPISCQGNNVKTITYSINKGAFQILDDPANSLVIDGEEIENLNAGMSKPQDATEDYQVRSFTRFTVAYDNQTPKGSDIMLVDDSVSGEYANRLFDANGEPDLESQRQALEEILSQVVIDCSVEYTDGSSASMSVSPSVRIALNTQRAEDSGSDFENEYLEVTIQKQ